MGEREHRDRAAAPERRRGSSNERDRGCEENMQRGLEQAKCIQAGRGSGTRSLTFSRLSMRGPVMCVRRALSCPLDGTTSPRTTVCSHRAAPPLCPTRCSWPLRCIGSPSEVHSSPRARCRRSRLRRSTAGHGGPSSKLKGDQVAKSASNATTRRLEQMLTEQQARPGPDKKSPGRVAGGREELCRGGRVRGIGWELSVQRSPGAGWDVLDGIVCLRCRGLRSSVPRCGDSSARYRSSVSAV